MSDRALSWMFLLATASMAGLSTMQDSLFVSALAWIGLGICLSDVILREFRT